ncbi:MAG: Gfo/Idh/MocA family oxidoreductase [Planctomycetota bacterium]
MTGESEAPDAVRVVVIGVGHLGKSHARILEDLPRAKLVGVVDVREEAARGVAEEHGVDFALDPFALPDDWRVEAVSIVTPTSTHGELASHFLRAGIDVLVEKPMTRTIEEGTRLCELAALGDRILQVGHVERFNPVVKAVRELRLEPRYVEGDRLAPFSFRSTDIGVVHDLMIHDIDLLKTLVDSEVEDVEAFGGAIFTPAEDLASARLRFSNGTIARLTANRVALKASRRMRMFSHDSYVSLDFGKQYGLIIQKAPGWDLRKLDLATVDADNIQDLWKFVFEGLLEIRELRMDEGDPLREEIEEFLECVSTRRRPQVDGNTAVAALATAQMVLDSIGQNRW